MRAHLAPVGTHACFYGSCQAQMHRLKCTVLTQLCVHSWDYFLPAYNCPLKEKIGIDRQLGDNGKWLCGVRTLLKKDHCVVYSFGSNGETTFEQDLLRKTKCDVHVFDPTLSPEVQKQVSSIKGVTLHNYGLGITDGMVRSLALPSIFAQFCIPMLHITAQANVH